MLYNLLQITRQQIAAAQATPCAAESLSTEEIFRDVTRQLTAITALIRPTELAHLIPLSRSAADLQPLLTKLLSHPIPKLWHKTNNKRPPQKDTSEKKIRSPHLHRQTPSRRRQSQSPRRRRPEAFPVTPRSTTIVFTALG